MGFKDADAVTCRLCDKSSSRKGSSYTEIGWVCLGCYPLYKKIANQLIPVLKSTFKEAILRILG